jgi:hypothetical protein
MKKKRRNNLENLYTYNSRKDEYEISLSLRNYEEIYNPYDFSQYKRRDMDEDFLDYIYHSSLDIPLGHKIKLKFNLKENVYDEEKSKNLKNAIKNNYTWRHAIINNRLKEKLKEAILLLIVGTIFLSLAFLIFPLIQNGGTILDLFGESVSIIGWVFLWDLVELLAFEVTKLHKKKKYLNRLINSKVEFEQY